MKIIIFTHSFPFSRGENFLFEEIIHFESEDQVIISPLLSGKYQVVKTNLEVVPLLKSNFISIIRFLIGLRGNLSLFTVDWFRCPMRTLKTIFILKNLLNSREITHLIKDSDILYFYWGVNQTVIAPYFKDKIKVARMHGYDLYCSGKYKQINIPFREKTIKNLDFIFPVSNLGTNYISNKFNHKNVETKRLGVKGNFKDKVKDFNGYRVVSCSSIIPLKQVELIAETIANSKLKIEWVHFGGGHKLDHLREKYKEYNFHFKGFTKNEDVLKFYRDNYIDLFLNFSSTEGVPVSAMEALSSGIPLFLSDVGANSELVNSTGVLFNSMNTSKEIASLMDNYLESDEIKTHRRNSVDFWNKYYNSESNYKDFYSFLKEIYLKKNISIG